VWIGEREQAGGIQFSVTPAQHRLYFLAGGAGDRVVPTDLRDHRSDGKKNDVSWPDRFGFG
jgi:hypothetical protein